MRTRLRDRGRRAYIQTKSSSNASGRANEFERTDSAAEVAQGRFMHRREFFLVARTRKQGDRWKIV
jgi:hypothetical protein